MQLSKNFVLSEFTFSETAERHGLKLIPSDDVKANLKLLVHNILQPMRDALGPVVITSGYRSEKLNELIGGSSTSQHMKGEAADLIVPGYTPLYVCKWIENSGLPFDQLIHEFGRWTHVSITRGVQRRETLTAYYDSTKQATICLPGIQEIPG